MWIFQIFNHNAVGPVCHLLHPCNFSHFHWLWLSQRIQLCHPLPWCLVLHPLSEFLHQILHQKGWQREEQWCRPTQRVNKEGWLRSTQTENATLLNVMFHCFLVFISLISTFKCLFSLVILKLSRIKSMIMPNILSSSSVEY